MNVSPWPLAAVFERHETVARTPEEKKALAQRLAATDPETLQWLVMVGATFGQSELVGYSTH